MFAYWSWDLGECAKGKSYWCAAHNQWSRISEWPILWMLQAAGGRSVHLVLEPHRHKWGEAAIHLSLLIASRCQDRTLTAPNFASFSLIELLEKNKLPLVVYACAHMCTCLCGCSMFLWVHVMCYEGQKPPPKLLLRHTPLVC